MVKIFSTIKRIFVCIILICIFMAPMVSAQQQNFFCGMYRDSVNRMGFVRLKGNEQHDVYVARYDLSGTYPKLVEAFLVTMEQVPGNNALWQTPQYRINQDDNHEIRFMIWDGPFPLNPVMPMLSADWNTPNNATSPDEAG